MDGAQEVSVRAARARFSELLDSAGEGFSTYVTRHGKSVAAIVSSNLARAAIQAATLARSFPECAVSLRFSPKGTHGEAPLPCADAYSETPSATETSTGGSNSTCEPVLVIAGPPGKGRSRIMANIIRELPPGTSVVICDQNNEQHLDDERSDKANEVVGTIESVYDFSQDPSPEFEQTAHRTSMRHPRERLRRNGFTPEQVAELEAVLGGPLDQLLATRNDAYRIEDNSNERSGDQAHRDDQRTYSPDHDATAQSSDRHGAADTNKTFEASRRVG